MRWVTYVGSDGLDRVGLLEGDVVHGLDSRTTLLEILRNGPDALDQAAHAARRAPVDTVALAEADLRPPLIPPSLRDSAGFLQHLRNTRKMSGRVLDRRYTDYPPFYFGNPGAVIGPYDDVPISPGCERFDYELEIAAVIGTPGANIALEDAERHIAGYMIFCDWSARDLQLAEMGLFGQAKGKDGANTLGPVLVTPDELEPFRSGPSFALRMTGYVNDVLISDGCWDTIDWGFADMITYTSRGVTLRTGDVIGSGTVPTGCLSEHAAMELPSFPGWLKPGDVVRLEVEQLGSTRQRIVEGVQAPPLLSTGY